MARCIRDNAADDDRRGGQQSHQQVDQQDADLVLTHPAPTGRVAQRIRQGYRPVLALRVVKRVDHIHMDEGGR